MGYGHWHRTEDGPEFREELITCPLCGELVDSDTLQCDNMYCDDTAEDEEGECQECGGPTYHTWDKWCDECLADLRGEDRADPYGDDQRDLPSDYSGVYYDAPIPQW